MTKIKICGLSRAEDIKAVNEALPDYIGFVFAESRRKVSVAQAAELKAILDGRIKTVGVFVNEPVRRVAELCARGIADIAQLHGDEDNAYIRSLKKEISCPIIKAVRVKRAADMEKADAMECDYLLFDTWDQTARGGSGRVFDWTLIGRIRKPFFLAGGLKLENIPEAMGYAPFCLDISSGVETDGKKDREKIIEVVKLVRSVS